MDALKNAKYPRKIFRSNSDPVILEKTADAVWPGLGPNPDMRIGAGRDKLDRVDEQIGDALSQGGLVAHDRQKRAFDGDGDLRRLEAGVITDDILYEAVQVDGGQLDLRPADFAVGQYIHDETVEAVGRAENAFQGVAGSGAH